MYPKVVVFDLDYTLWPCWCDTHISPPVKAKSTDIVIDKRKFELSFYKDVPKIFEELIANDVLIVSASRTCAPAVARKLLTLLHINDQPAIDHFDFMEWGTFSKTKHIKAAMDRIKQEMDLDIPFEEVILFDDEWRNKDVESIGVHFAHLPNEDVGLTYDIFQKALFSYREKKQL
ncbi:hypothetical protein WICPIJ_000454 [Wickerhamomyces pijperi]|uniref:Magnesium-dependent phosphatase-1 n=1 Tax=Wickerhamomyces pijperi TaxID=599730 RepID=A0A9P8QDM2_WICPI|nr:hypothetical protein WICPIJ_000454 [Wickerhamomyces pijperi]